MPSRTPRPVPAIAVAAAKLRAGSPQEAIEPLREAIARRPGDAALLHDLGLACLETGRLAEAIDALRRSAASRPDYTDAWFRLGLALERAGDRRGAVVAYDRATELLPSLTEAWYRAGALVFTLGHPEEAIGCFRRAASAGRKSSFGRLGEARALLAEGRDAAAAVVLRRLLARDPSNAVAQDLLGNVLADEGRFGEARDCFVRAIEAAPLMAGSYYDLVRCRRTTADDAGLVAGMRAALALPGLETEQRARVHLALGKAADDVGDHGAAMAEFDAADAARSRLASFDPVEFDRQVDRMIARFEAGAVAGEPDATPVLIVGMPRSGTTLTEQIVSSHPAVAAGGELNFWNERGAAWLASGANWNGAALGRAATDYLARLRSIGPQAARVTDKMPFNFLWAGLVHRALPKATIVHCRRAAIDTALSIHQTHFNPMLALPTGGEALVAYIRSYRRLMAHWRLVLPPERFVEIDYNDLTGAPEATIRRLIGACGLAWDAACLRPEANPRAVRTPSRWQARQPIYRDAVERWRRYEPWLGPLRALLEDD